jgi:hypothetical protein
MPPEVYGLLRMAIDERREHPPAGEAMARRLSPRFGLLPEEINAMSAQKPAPDPYADFTARFGQSPPKLPGTGTPRLIPY